MSIEDYRDIIHLPHHQSPTRPRMPMIDRAAQFAPFAALTGYDSAIVETGRLTDRRIEPDDDRKEQIDRVLQSLREREKESPAVCVTFFEPDEKKAGGRYLTAVGAIRRIDEYERVILLADGSRIPIDDIYAIEETTDSEEEQQKG